MVTAVQQLGRMSHNQQTRSHSGSITFTLPSSPASVATSLATMPSTQPANLLSLQEAPRNTAGPKPGPLALQTTQGSKACVAANYRQYVGRSTGSGQCVALAQAAAPGLGATRGWTRGEAVQGNTGLHPGTVIATFSRSGRYANATDGSNHAAIYLGQNARGIQVLDQWAGSAAAIRTIAWHNPSGIAANTGAAYHVVNTNAPQHPVTS